MTKLIHTVMKEYNIDGYIGVNIAAFLIQQFKNPSYTKEHRLSHINLRIGCVPCQPFL
ncbi:hypothetical protein BQ1740_3961 [Bacillus subtilis]|nr:hypothetical protein BQ1740_3961 [Bacillus subtilis]